MGRPDYDGLVSPNVSVLGVRPRRVVNVSVFSLQNPLPPTHRASSSSSVLCFVNSEMSAVNITNVTVLDNPASFLTPFQFEISYECLTALKDGFYANFFFLFFFFFFFLFFFLGFPFSTLSLGLVSSQFLHSLTLL